MFKKHLPILCLVRNLMVFFLVSRGIFVLNLCDRTGLIDDFTIRETEYSTIIKAGRVDK